MLNKVMLIGNLGADPSVHETKAGDPVANFTLATNRRWKDADGERQEETEWHRIVCFRHTAAFAGEYLRTGRKVYIEGRLRTRKWQKGGVDVFTTEVIADQVQALGQRQDEADEAETTEAEAA